MDTIALKPKLTRLKLSGILDTLGSRLEQAQGEKWSYSQFLDFLLSDEVERRDHKQLVRRLSKSGLDPEKTLTTFDFSFNPKIHEPTIRELATCRFLEKNECLLLLGPSGVGKSRLAQAIGNEVEGKGALCLSCADLDHLIFLPAGDPALTRRARKHSILSAVVLKWSRARKRYERQGLLVEEQAIERAEAESLADSEVRARRREREAERRTELGHEYVERFALRVRGLFPVCPTGRARAIAEHACRKYSGRIGRSAAGKSLDEEAIRLAVTAHVRHTETLYDELLAGGRRGVKPGNR